MFGATTTDAGLADPLASPVWGDHSLTREVALGAVGMLLRARFRQRRRSWLLLCLLIALVSALVLAAAAAGRGTATAFPRYEAAHGYDAYVFSAVPIPKIGALPEVTLVTPLQVTGGGTPACACSRPINYNYFTVVEAPPSDPSPRS